MPVVYNASGFVVGGGDATSFRTLAFSSANHESNSVRAYNGDKVVLAETVFQKLLMLYGEQSMPSPLTFQVRSVNNPDNVCHCGVLEFSGESPDMSFIPETIMKNLCIDEGEEVQFQLRKLPPAQHLTLKPLSAAFGKISDPQGSLRVALQEYTCLTDGDILRLSLSGREYPLYVQSIKALGGHGTATTQRLLRCVGEGEGEAKSGSGGDGANEGMMDLGYGQGMKVGPAQACCVVDTDLTVEFAESGIEQPETQTVEFPKIAPTEPLWSGMLDSGKSRKFRIKTPSRESASGMILSLTVFSGEADVFLGTHPDTDITNCKWVLLSDPSTSGISSQSGNSGKTNSGFGNFNIPVPNNTKVNVHNSIAHYRDLCSHTRRDGSGMGMGVSHSNAPFPIPISTSLSPLAYPRTYHLLLPPTHEHYRFDTWLHVTVAVPHAVDYADTLIKGVDEATDSGASAASGGIGAGAGMATAAASRPNNRQNPRNIPATPEKNAQVVFPAPDLRLSHCYTGGQVAAVEHVAAVSSSLLASSASTSAFASSSTSTSHYNNGTGKGTCAGGVNTTRGLLTQVPSFPSFTSSLAVTFTPLPHNTPSNSLANLLSSISAGSAVSLICSVENDATGHVYTAPTALSPVSKSSSPSSAASPSSASSTTEVPPGHRLCPHCHTAVPSASYTLHEMQCARVSVKCGTCATMLERRVAHEHQHCLLCNHVCSPAMLWKHMLVMHSVYDCERCGGDVAVFAADAHTTVCKNRGIKCRYCDALIAQREHTQHQQRCGHMKRPCPYCDQPVVSNVLETHCATNHGMNPSFGLPDPHQWRMQHDPMYASTHANTSTSTSTSSDSGSGAGASGMTPEFEALYRAQLAAQGIDEQEDPDLAMCIRMSMECSVGAGTANSGNGSGVGGSGNSSAGVAAAAGGGGGAAMSDDAEDNRFGFLNDSYSTNTNNNTAYNDTNTPSNTYAGSGTGIGGDAGTGRYESQPTSAFTAAAHTGYPCPICGRMFDAWELDEHLDECVG